MVLAESLVEEWFNRNGYFTIRGIKVGVDEIDILAIKQVSSGKWEYVHCEVQVGVRPVTYISKLTNKLVDELGVKPNSAKKRNDEQLNLCVTDWVNTKFFGQKKRSIRDSLVAGANWTYMFVHGRVKDERELQFIEDNGIELVPFEEVIDDLCNKGENDFVASSAGELIEIVNFYRDKRF